MTGFHRFNQLLLVPAFLLISLLPGIEAGRSKIRLVNGGYERVVIAIGEDVEENLELIERIKTVFTEVSAFMFSATNQQVYLSEIRVLLPESWNDQPFYKPNRWERFENSDIRVDVPTTTKGNVPYVNKPTGCGKPGLYLHITPEYLMNEQIGTLFGPYDKTLTHEWAHLRWGVFDEYPLQGDQKFYAASDGSIQGTRCVLAIEGEWRRLTGRRCTVGNDGFPEESDCYFADKMESGRSGASLMYRQYLEGLETFCDSEEYVGSWEGGLHNSEAPNKQNKLCDGKSIWEVMREHNDFADYDTRIVEASHNATPSFKIVKKESTRTVIVMDVSGSMHGEKTRLLRAAVYNLLNLVLRKGHLVGLVSFSHRVTVLANLTETDDDGKTMLLDCLPQPDRVGGGTSIAKGVLEGLSVLSHGYDGPAGGKLLVITDGKETSHPKLDRVTDEELEGVVVDTIAVGPDADDSLEHLAQRTGGESYYHLDGTSDIIGAFSAQAAAQRAGTRDLQTVPILNTFQPIQPFETLTVPFVIDKSTSGCLSVLLTSLHWDAMDAWIKSPDGVIIDRQSKEYSNVSQFDLISFEIEDNVKIGFWDLIITNTKSNEEEGGALHVTIMIESGAAEDEIPISVSAEWAYPEVQPPQKQILYATVARGYVPIINCQVEATIEFSNASAPASVTLNLLDNGSGADVSADDGIYSAYFTHFLGRGRYAAKIQVKNKGSETKIANGALVGFGAAMPPNDLDQDYSLDLQDTGNFQRQTVGNSFSCIDEELCQEGAVDVYPPAKITDLFATNVDFDLLHLNLSFTAPGDDLAEGTVSYYEVWFSTEFASFRKNVTNGELLGSENFTGNALSEPSPAGSAEVLTHLVQSTGGSFSYFFAVIAVDDEGNRGPVSNIASSSLRDFRPTGSSWFIGLIIATGIILFIMLNIVAFLLVCACVKSAMGKKDKYNIQLYQKVSTDSGSPSDLKSASPIQGPENC